MLGLITLDKKKCIHCKLCVMSCPAGTIEMRDDVPAQVREACIACGHCTAVCPTEAIDNAKAPRAKQAAIPKLPIIDKQTAKNYLRSRRSMRIYEMAVPSEKEITELLDVARFAPTAINSQGISFIAVRDQQKKKAIIEATVCGMEQMVADNKAAGEDLSSYIDAWRKHGIDKIMRGAPCLLIAYAPKGFIFGRQNAISQFTYAELYANTMGLGTCWAGFVEQCLFTKPKGLMNLLGFPPDTEPVGALLAGYPLYPTKQFKRLPDRNPLNLKFV